ncbi:type II toxin-antitoxin system VapC family toxin [Amycolatopsis pithecellobii]|uniref:Type II toxin-antitoxin system VapC family toxin n=1 Tax=Amycolatopsis pithecellobii TaxID=664692 RepID=A0A6N7YWK1_9PSEU|nr:type II toxin-antitoxin system VapC family toxin [Amycolatopsis pithecellobii]MTD52709.1 type II toxin-antitoxin system VapC family toxin [Amycolatopsis pithecellobii]
MAERPRSGVLDTCTYLDLHELDPADLPREPELTAITFAELHQGVTLARDNAVRAARMEQLGAALTEFTALPFDDLAASRYGSLVALTVEAGRSPRPRPRRLDLQIAAIASSLDLPLYTRNADDFKGLESAVTIVPV